MLEGEDSTTVHRADAAVGLAAGKGELKASGRIQVCLA